MTDHVSEQIWPPVSRTIDNTGYDRGSYAHKGEFQKDRIYNSKVKDQDQGLGSEDK